MRLPNFGVSKKVTRIALLTGVMLIPAITGISSLAGTAQTSSTPTQQDLVPVKASSSSGAVNKVVYPNNCPVNALCLYPHANFGGRPELIYPAYGRVKRVDLLARGFNDSMSSWWNRTNVDARWFQHVGAKGTTRCMDYFTSVPWVGQGDNDQASWVEVYTDDRACD